MKKIQIKESEIENGLNILKMDKFIVNEIIKMMKKSELGIDTYEIDLFPFLKIMMNN